MTSTALRSKSRNDVRNHGAIVRVFLLEQDALSSRLLQQLLESAGLAASKRLRVALD